jgi:hypothetical protein
MFAFREVLRQPKSLKCLCKYSSRSTFFLEIFYTVTVNLHLIVYHQFNSHCMFRPCSAIEATYIVYWFSDCFFFAGLLVVAIVCFILVIVEATYIVYWFGEWFFFAGFSVAACFCFAGDLSCASAFHHFRVILDAVVSFCIPCLLFSLQFASKNVCLFVVACSLCVSGSFSVWVGVS